MQIKAIGNYITHNTNTNLSNNITGKFFIKKQNKDSINFSGNQPAKMSNEEFARRQKELFPIMEARFQKINCDCKLRRLRKAKKHINKINIAFAEKIFSNPAFNLKHAEAIIKHTDRKNIFGKRQDEINAKTINRLEELYLKHGAYASFSLALYAENPEAIEKEISKN